MSVNQVSKLRRQPELISPDESRSRRPDRLRGRVARRVVVALLRIAWVDADGDITMPPTGGAAFCGTGIKAYPASLSRLLIQHGFTVKKTLRAGEADHADIVRARHMWQERRQSWMKKRPERLVFCRRKRVNHQGDAAAGPGAPGAAAEDGSPVWPLGNANLHRGCDHDGLTAPWVINSPHEPAYLRDLRRNPARPHAQARRNGHRVVLSSINPGAASR